MARRKDKIANDGLLKETVKFSERCLGNDQ